jgi:hypothetical protein
MRLLSIKVLVSIGPGGCELGALAASRSTSPKLPGRGDVGLVIRRNLGKSSAELPGCQAAATASTSRAGLDGT